MKKIMIATPSYDGKLEAWYTNALCQTILAGLQNDIEFLPLFMCYDALVQRARNDLVGVAIGAQCDGVLWIDADIDWEPSWAIDLVKSGKDVVGLPCIKKSLTEEQYNVKCDVPDLVVQDGYIKVQSVGTGFLYTSLKAIQHLWDSSEPYTHNNKQMKWVFEVGLKDGDIISEDVKMCEKLRNGGFDVYIDPSKTCGHTGPLRYVGDFEKFIPRVKEHYEQAQKQQGS